MSLAILKDKGQITLPAEIRKQVRAGKGDIFDCEVVDGKVVLTLKKLVSAEQVSGREPKKSVDISSYFGSMKGQFGSVEDISV